MSTGVFGLPARASAHPSTPTSTVVALLSHFPGHTWYGPTPSHVARPQAISNARTSARTSAMRPP